jgi:hypothetical protein
MDGGGTDLQRERSLVVSDGKDAAGSSGNRRRRRQGAAAAVGRQRLGLETLTAPSYTAARTAGPAGGRAIGWARQAGRAVGRDLRDAGRRPSASRARPHGPVGPGRRQQPANSQAGRGEPSSLGRAMQQAFLFPVSFIF